MKTKGKLFLIVLSFLFLFNNNISSSIPTQDVIVSYGDILNEPVKKIDPNKPMIALTFDDGPTREYTEMILDCLKENGAYATFFVLGSRIEKAPDLLKRMVLEGHEIGNHTFTHKQLTTLTEKRIAEEIAKSNKEIFRVTNNYPQVIRPPYGDYNESVLNYLGEMKIVKWTIDSEDWRSQNTKTIVDKIKKEVSDRSIILLHDLFLSTAQASCILIPQLIEEGYQFVTVSDLYAYEQK